MSDRHIRRDGDAYGTAILNLLPYGPAWPRHESSVLVRAVRGLANYWGFVDKRAADLLEIESDPTLTVELLPDWERNWGLPDICFGDAQSLDQRHRLLLMKMTLLGGQSRQWFITMAAWLGYVISITEYSPFTCGLSQVGDTRDPTSNNDWRWEIGAPEMRFYWTVHINAASLHWFRAGSAELGYDPFLRFGIPDPLYCMIERWKPAHTQVIFDINNMTNDGYADWPPNLSTVIPPSTWFPNPPLT
jgi:uncharacterized protein YmfQ (DUF2313 family)